jgi:alpha-1,3/alpha-1,6-mannosyltransferase
VRVRCVVGTLDVRVRGNTLMPPSIFSRFSILCAIVRQLHLILHITFISREIRPGIGDVAPDAFFVDQLSAGLPLLRHLLPRAPIFFYCHFPDLLLAQGRARWWKRLYRVSFDVLEQWSMGFADVIAVNSGFTKGIVTKTWPSLAGSRDLQIVYPCIATAAATNKSEPDEGTGGLEVWRKMGVILSINRFERKKDVALAIKAFAGLSKEKRKGAKLVVAGKHSSPLALPLSPSPQVEERKQI